MLQLTTAMNEAILVRTSATFLLTNRNHGPTKIFFNNQDTFATIIRDLWEEWEVQLGHADIWCFPDGTACFFRDLQNKRFEELADQEETIYIMMSDVDPPRDPANLVCTKREGEFSLFWDPSTVITEDLERFKREFQQVEEEQDDEDTENEDHNDKYNQQLPTPPRGGTVTPVAQQLTLHVHFGAVSLELQMDQSHAFDTLINVLPLEWAINSSCALFYGNSRLAWQDTPHQRHFVGGEHVGVVDVPVLANERNTTYLCPLHSQD